MDTYKKEIYNAVCGEETVGDVNGYRPLLNSQSAEKAGGSSAAFEIYSDG